MSYRESPGVRGDTQSRPEGTRPRLHATQELDQPVIDRRGTLSPRVAGAAQTRGAQPPGRRITICQLCRKRAYRVRNGEWYHRSNASAFCHPGDGTGRKTVPLEIEVTR